MKAFLMTFLIAMTPVVELRGAIPSGVLAGLSIWQAAAVSIVGNLVPVPFVIIFARAIFKWLRKTFKFLGGSLDRLEAKIERNKEKVLKYEFWGLVLLVAIPLPGTGAWTGAAVAAMMDLQLKRAVPAITLGVLVAATIVSLVTGGVAILS